MTFCTRSSTDSSRTLGFLYFHLSSRGHWTWPWSILWSYCEANSNETAFPRTKVADIRTTQDGQFWSRPGLLALERRDGTRVTAAALLNLPFYGKQNMTSGNHWLPLKYYLMWKTGPNKHEIWWVFFFKIMLIVDLQGWCWILSIHSLHIDSVIMKTASLSQIPESTCTFLIKIPF